jgi:hypothetical protein
VTPQEIRITLKELRHATRPEQRSVYERALHALAELIECGYSREVLESAVPDHRSHVEEFTCVYPQPGCQIEALPAQWRDRAVEILTCYRQSLAAEGMLRQGCCCGHEHQKLDAVAEEKLRSAGFLIEHDSESLEP